MQNLKFDEVKGLVPCQSEEIWPSLIRPSGFAMPCGNSPETLQWKWSYLFHFIACHRCVMQLWKVKFLSLCLLISLVLTVFSCHSLLVAIFASSLTVLFLPLFIPDIYIPVWGGHLEKCFGMNVQFLYLVASFHLDCLEEIWAGQPLGWFVRVSPKLRNLLDLSFAFRCLGFPRHSCTGAAVSYLFIVILWVLLGSP